MNTTRVLPLALAAALAGCASVPAPSAQSAFFDRVAALCGRAFEGRIVEDRPTPTGADPFTGQRLVMHVRECSADEIRIPFHVGIDRSRTWVITRTGGGLRLEHDHRHSDGSPDALTMYGGDTRSPGTAGRQEFPAHAASKAMFLAQNRAVSVDNVWAMEIEPGRMFVYELARPQRLFRVQFDLTRPITAPPPPWGAAGTAAPAH